MNRNFCVVALIGVCLCVGCRDQPADSSQEPSRPPLVSPPAAEADAAQHLAPGGTLPSFRMIGTESGLDFERFDDIGPLHRILEVNGGGVGMFDFDVDGRPDLFFTNGARLPLVPDDRDSPSELFRNRGRMQFQQDTGPARLRQFGYSNGCAVGDFDADGFDDLYVTAYGPNALWHNNGDGTFSRAAESTGTALPQWSTSAAFADLNGDGHLDLYVVNYVVESDTEPILCHNPDSPDGYESCPPSKYEGVDDVLLLSDGAGGFRDMTAQAGLAGLKGKGLGVVVCDLDGRPGPEIYVANDGEPNFLFVQNREESDVVSAPAESSEGADARLSPPLLHYEDRALFSGVALNESGFAQASMGVTAGDFDADGTTDLFLTHFFEDTNTLYANRGGLFFNDMTRHSKLGPDSRGLLGFGTAALDADNDGWLDLIVANGHVDDRTWKSAVEPYRMRPQMFRNERDGTFVEVSKWAGEYFHKEWLGRGLAVGDLDRDGRIDVAVSHQLAPSCVLQNETPTAVRALALRLIGTSGNRTGYGTRVERVDADGTIVRELMGGGSFQSASLPEVYLGIGARASATIRVHWPSGAVETYADLPAGHWAVVENHGAMPLPVQ